MKKYFGWILLLLLILPAIKFLFGTGYFNMHDDLQVMRMFEMDKCFADGQIPCRWAPDMGYGYGQAMFNFYSAFPYYFGELLRIATPLTYLGTVKMLFLSSFVLGAGGMYLLAKEFWGKTGGILSAVLYTYAPYHALDVYVRGAMAEAFALGFLPFLLHSFYLLIKRPDFKRVVYAGFTLAAVLTTHNISTMLYAPPTLLWVIFWLIRTKKWKHIYSIGLSGVIGVGLAAFFIIPAVIEQSLIQTEYLTSGYSDYRAHFVTLKQLFIQRSWGDGPSIFGTEDTMSFQIGWPHWLLGVLSGLVALKTFANKNKSKSIIVLGSLGIAGVAAFLTHPRSVVIWDSLPLISFVQFPWRLLGLVIFFLSFASGILSKIRFGKFFAATLILLTIVLNISYFEPVNFSRQVRDEEKLTGVAFELQQKAAILDYLPKTAELAPPDKAPDSPKIISGDGQFRGYLIRSNRFSFDAEIYNDAEVEVPIMYFPNWTVLVDGKVVPTEIQGAHGLIKFDVPEGNHIIRGRFLNTPVRSVSNAITLIAFSFVFVGLIIYSNKGKFLV